MTQDIKLANNAPFTLQFVKKNYKNQGNKNKANIFFEKYISEYLAKNVIRKLLTSLNKLLKSESVKNI